MKKHIIGYTLTIILTALLTCALTLLFVAFSNVGKESDFRLLNQVRRLIDKNAVFDFSEAQANANAVRGYLTGLEADEYTQFWTPEEYKQYLDGVAGKFSGIGITIQSDDPISEGLFVYRVLGNSPALRVGLRPGDLIVGVDGDSILGKNYQEVYDGLLGEEGSSLRLKILRNGETFDVSVQREDFVQNYVDYRKIGDLGYIRIHSFMPSAQQEFSAALDDLIAQGVTGWIFDLRNNLGGGLNTVIQILDLLVPKDEVVVIKYKDSEEVFHSSGNRKTELPMVVLINDSSASASELMSSCLRDLNGSKLIGTRSYGKGIGQTTFDLPDGSAVKMTTFYYLTKSRTNYHGIGLEPDFTTELDEHQKKYFYALTDGEDPQLQKAISVLSAN